MTPYIQSGAGTSCEPALTLRSTSGPSGGPRFGSQHEVPGQARCWRAYASGTAPNYLNPTSYSVSDLV